jgi:hypothetical protein
MRIVFTFITVILITISPLKSEVDFLHSKKNMTLLYSPIIKKEEFESFSRNEDTQPCNPNTPEILGDYSQLPLVNFYEKVAVCMTMGDSDPKLKLDQRYCDAVEKCNKQKNKVALLEGDFDFIENEAIDLLARESTESEMAKYQSGEAYNYRKFLSFTEKLPKKELSEIKKYLSENTSCREDKVEPHNICNKNDDSATMVKHYIMTSSDLFTKEKAQKLINFENDKNEIERFAVVSRKYSENEKANFQKTFNELKEQEIEYANKIFDSNFEISSINDNDKFKDDVVDNIYDKLKSESNISKNDLKDIVKNELLSPFNISNRSDYILTYDKENLKEVLEKSLNDKSFDLKTTIDKGNVSDYINKIRVNVAKLNIAKSCADLPSDIDHVCSNITKNMSSQNIFKVTAGDPFNRIIKYYQNSKIPNKEEIIAKILKYQGVDKQLLRNELVFALKKHVCANKFNSNRKPDKINKGISEKLFNQEIAANAVRDQAVTAFQAAASSNKYLRKELDSLAIALPADHLSKNNQLASKSATNNEPMTVNNTIQTDSMIPNGFSPNESVKTNNIMPTPMTPPPMPMPVGTITAQGFSKNLNSSTEEKTLQDKIASLEKQLATKEEAISKDGKSTDNMNPKDKLEMASMRAELDNLKKEQLKNIASKSSTPVDQANTTPSRFQNTPNNYRPTNNNYSPNYQPIPSASNINTNTVASPAVPSNSSAIKKASANGSSEKMNALLTSIKGNNVQGGDIPNNPTDADILKRLAENKEQSFLVKDKDGVLMRVLKIAEIDGKITYKLIRLNAEDIAKLNTAIDNATLSKIEDKKNQRNVVRRLQLQEIMKKTFPTKPDSI